MEFDLTAETIWSIETDAGGEWNQDLGRFKAEKTGEWEVKGDYSNEEQTFSDDAILTVIPGNVSEVKIHPEEDQEVEAGKSIDFSAEAYDEYGNLIEDDDSEFVWQNTDGTGYFYQEIVGDYPVLAEYHEETGMASSKIVMVSVTASDVHSLEIIDYPESLKSGDSFIIKVQSKDEYGNIAANKELENFKVVSEHDGTVYGPKTIFFDDNGEYHAEIDENNVKKVDPEHKIEVFGDKGYDYKYINVYAGDIHSYYLKVDDIKAGENPIIHLSDAKDKHENTVNGYQSVDINIDETTKTVTLEFIDGKANYTWYHMETSGIYTAETWINNVHRTDDFYVSSGKTSSYLLQVEDIVKGDSPILEFSNATDIYGNKLEGVYEVTYDLCSDSKHHNVTFVDGEGSLDTEEIFEEHGEYNAKTWIDGVKKEHSFTVWGYYIDFDDGWTAYSPSMMIQDAKIVGDGTIIDYRGNVGWRLADEKAGQPQMAYYFSPEIKGIYFNEDEDYEGMVTTTLHPEWNLVGAYDNTKVTDVFSPIKHALNSVMYPLDNYREVDSNMMVGGTIFGFSVDSGNPEGYAVKEGAYWLRVSEESVLSTIPLPTMEEPTPTNNEYREE